MREWYLSALCNYPFSALANSWTHSAACGHNHVTTPISRTRPSPFQLLLIVWNPTIIFKTISLNSLRTCHKINLRHLFLTRWKSSPTFTGYLSGKESISIQDCTTDIQINNHTLTHLPVGPTSILNVIMSSPLQQPLSASQCWGQNCFRQSHTPPHCSGNLELITCWSDW